MIKYVRKNKKKIIVSVVVLLVLVITFWYGNGTKESRGFSMHGNQSEEKLREENEAQRDFTLNDATQQDSEQGSIGVNGQQESREALENNQRLDDGGIAIGEKTDQLDQNGQEIQSSESIVPTGNENQGEVIQLLECTFSISCASVLQEENWNRLEPSTKSIIPADGWILGPVTVQFQKGETVYDVLNQETKRQNVLIDAAFTPGFQTWYIKGIGNLYEKDCGNESGWTYYVNGKSAPVGASSYQLSDGDVVEWKYYCGR